MTDPTNKAFVSFMGLEVEGHWIMDSGAISRRDSIWFRGIESYPEGTYLDIAGHYCPGTVLLEAGVRTK